MIVFLIFLFFAFVLTTILSTFLDSILKSKYITLPTEVHIVKAMIFPVVMYRCESWTIKKAEFCFQIVVLEKTLENPLDCKEIILAHPKGDKP